MQQARRRTTGKNTPDKLPSIQKRIREGVLILTLALTAYLLLALFTYHSTDPSWSYVSQSNHVANAGGKVGALFADILLYVFGFGAFIFPVMLTYAAFLFYQVRSERDSEFHYYHLSMRIAGFVFILAPLCALLSMRFHGSFSHLPFTAGGIIGNMISGGMIQMFNQVGSIIILVALLLAGITLFTGLSWLKTIDVVGHGASNLSVFSYKFFRQLQWSKLLPKRSETPLEAKPTKPKIIRNEPKIKEVVRSAPTPAPTAEKTKEKQANNLVFKATHEGGLPPVSLLDSPDGTSKKGYSNSELEALSRNVEEKLQDFNINAKVMAVHPGPVVTRFELDLAAGTKVSRISSLAKDLARSLSVTSVRVVEVIPGKTYVGIELPNQHREIVRLREVLSSEQYQQARSPISLALGKDIAGHPVVVDLAKMPHLLVAGTTGSGKSVGVNAMLLSLLHKASPNELRLILLDPKMLELSVYDGIPHLLTPVVTDMKDAANALRWCVAEMERRYKLMAALGVRNLAGYNNAIKAAQKKGAPLLDPLWKKDQDVDGQPDELQELPFIVVIADEFADMMMVVGKKVEELIARIAQKARAAGIHLILATQRPSVDVITGLIKANIPTRIAFQVSSKIDSRTILDQSGAEQLLGHGDMLYLPPGTGVPVRVHGAFVDDAEVHRVVKDWRKRGEPAYLDEITQGGQTGDPLIDADGAGDSDAEQDALYDQAVEFVLQSRRASISSVQRRFKIGYNRAARIIEAMEAAGILGPMEKSGSREILVPVPAEN